MAVEHHHAVLAQHVVPGLDIVGGFHGGLSIAE
jgi:hypothetical protein